MTLATEEFMRRFLLHVLPSGFHRIRHYGLLANANRKTNIATARELLHQPAPPACRRARRVGSADHGSHRPTFVCRHCGAPMLIIETFARAQHIRGPPVIALTMTNSRFNRHSFASGIFIEHPVANARGRVLQNVAGIATNNRLLNARCRCARGTPTDSRFHATAIIRPHPLLPTFKSP